MNNLNPRRIVNSLYHFQIHSPWAKAGMPLLFLFTLFQGALSAQELGRFISTHFDPWTPNFGHPPNISAPVFYSIQDGVWSDPDTWGGTTPTADATAVISHSIAFSSDTEVFDVVLQSGGRLSFSTTENTRLTVGTIQVHKDAMLEIGTLSQPVEANVQAVVVFTDRAFDHSLDPAQYGNGLIVFGNLDIHGSPHPSPFVHLADEALAGDSMLNLESPAIGWKIGDELMLPDTRQTDPRPSRGFVSFAYKSLPVVMARGTLALPGEGEGFLTRRRENAKFGGFRKA